MIPEIQIRSLVQRWQNGAISLFTANQCELIKLVVDQSLDRDNPSVDDIHDYERGHHTDNAIKILSLEFDCSSHDVWVEYMNNL